MGATLAICSTGLFTLALSGVVSLPVIVEQPSTAAQASLCLLAASMMTARSPASAIAIISEMACNHLPIAKVVLGVTVLGDVVVLVIFALCTNLAKVTTEGGTFS